MNLIATILLVPLVLGTVVLVAALLTELWAKLRKRR